MIVIFPINFENNIVDDARKKVSQVGIALSTATSADFANVTHGHVDFVAIREVHFVEHINLHCELHVVKITGEAELRLKIRVARVTVTIHLTVVHFKAGCVIQCVRNNAWIETVAQAVISIS